MVAVVVVVLGEAEVVAAADAVATVLVFVLGKAEVIATDDAVVALVVAVPAETLRV